MELRELQALLRRLENLLEMQRMEQNREATADPAVTGSIHTVLATLEQEITAVCEAIQRPIDNHPGLRQQAALLETIPGVSTTTAAWLLTLLAAHRDFDNPKQAVAFAGQSSKQCLFIDAASPQAAPDWKNGQDVTPVLLGG